MTASSRAAFAVPLPQLHHPESGRIDAMKVAEYLAIPLSDLAQALDAKYPSVHKTPDAATIQRRLAPFKRILELISRVTRNRREARAWLNNPHPDLGDRTPIDVMLTGHAGAVVTLLENAIAGLPS